jgi:uncharacterized protein YdeI (YjbR/CyaY-like superfamily)
MNSMTEPPNSIHPKTRAELRAWLEQHHSQAEGVWLISYKKSTGRENIRANQWR